MKIRKLVIGIDPGVTTGGFAVLPENYDDLHVEMTPVFPTVRINSTGTKSGFTSKSGGINIPLYCEKIKEACFTFYKELGKDERGVIMTIFEDVHNIKNSSSISNFHFGERKGEIRGMANMLRCLLDELFGGKITIIVDTVSPVIWQKHCVDFTDKVFEKGKVNTKESSIRSALRHFPNTNFTKGRGTTPQDGMTDAALIAKYGMEVAIPNHPIYNEDF